MKLLHLLLLWDSKVSSSGYEDNDVEYIVVDLEWNQSPQGKEMEEKRLPFEIIEIGAVKLNNNFQKVEVFRAIIKPQVYREIHVKTKEIIHLDMNELKKGETFPSAIKNFFQWCGSDVIFCTWGPADLVELQRNMSYYGITGYIETAIPYYDVQKLFSLEFEREKIARSLEYAVDFLQLEKKQKFHSAICDAEYTAEIIKLLDKELIKKYYSIDYYNNPKTKNDEIFLTYDSYSKYISMEYNTKEDAFVDNDVKASICYKCGKKAVKKIRWFTANSKNYYSLAYCKNHGFLKGKIRIKKAENGKIFVVKTMKLISEAEAQEIYDKREDMRKRKQLKMGGHSSQ